MPSSLIFAALAAAWLVVLVPMFARRRQEVSKTTDSALAARVVRRGSGRRPATPGAATTDEVEEAFGMPDTDRDEALEEIEEHEADGSWRRVHSDDVRAGRRYRPGRGGFDPEAAALAARVKYARRQRIVLVMLLLAVTTALLAAMVWPVLWWVHGITDLSTVGYLTYLRRQVRIEEDVRSRRLARMSGEHGEYDGYDDAEIDDQLVDEYDEDDDREDGRPADRRPDSSAVRVEIDDEDPMFDELDERTWEPYRRASGE
ncbi:gephyrin-like molybdotransferase receptor GlpR [Saccharopolyspora sp. NPDC050642]|uniref:divisome protein SepX/GlpR n=1 Tax=Saccharopolyspora sp. NPDC050642 TaxID=3157099 RepID=UPI0033F67434